MSNYNASQFVGKTIESVLSQTYSDWEFLIVDDCSTDDSIDVIKRYLTDDRIRLIRHDANKGYVVALKTAIADVRSDTFGVLDSDDDRGAPVRRRLGRDSDGEGAAVGHRMRGVDEQVDENLFDPDAVQMEHG